MYLSFRKKMYQLPNYPIFFRRKKNNLPKLEKCAYVSIFNLRGILYQKVGELPRLEDLKTHKKESYCCFLILK